MVCRKREPVAELLKFVVEGQGVKGDERLALRCDPLRRLPGRGAHCHFGKCLTDKRAVTLLRGSISRGSRGSRGKQSDGGGRGAGKGQQAATEVKPALWREETLGELLESAIVLFDSSFAGSVPTNKRGLRERLSLAGKQLGGGGKGPGAGKENQKKIKIRF